VIFNDYFTVQEHHSEVSLDCSRVRNALDAFVEEKVAVSTAQWLDDMNELAECENNVMNEQETLIKEAHSNLHKYVSDDLKQDLPTG